MKRFKQLFIPIVLIVVFCVIFTSCLFSPPDVTSAEARFQDNYEDIQIVVDYMINSEYASVYINSADGMMLADLTDVKIPDEKVNSAVKRLLKTSYRSISKHRHTIEFNQWGHLEIGCGIAYSTKDDHLPYVQYCTELIPLSETGWYYYVDDYNEWRVGKRPQIKLEQE